MYNSDVVEDGSSIEQGKSRRKMRFEPTQNGGHRIVLGEENFDDVAPATLRAALEAAKPMPLAGQVGGSKSDMTHEQARALFERHRQDDDPHQNNLFFVEYAHGESVGVGANHLPDGSAQLVDKEGRALPEDKERAIFENVKDFLDEQKAICEAFEYFLDDQKGESEQ